ncbi:MAG TPA: OsmC family protein [Blastocatellia bacterium]|nr:OsmC family protein [Blastocatellia bacterium]
MAEQVDGELKVARLEYAARDSFLAESQSGHAVVTGFAQGDSTSPSPMELLLISLGGCTGADVYSILRKKRQKVTGYTIEVRGVRREEHPRIYTAIEVVHQVRGRKVDPAAVAHAIELSETKYCSVSAMLGTAAKITSHFEITEEE